MMCRGAVLVSKQVGCRRQTLDGWRARATATDEGTAGGWRESGGGGGFDRAGSAVLGECLAGATSGPQALAPFATGVTNRPQTLHPLGPAVGSAGWRRCP